MAHVCYYHSVDLDGHCSGAIFKYFMQKHGYDFKLIPYNYNDKIDLKDITDHHVYFIDCSPQPLDQYLREILYLAKEVTIIDHHKTLLEHPLYLEAVTDPKALEKFITASSLETAACELAWKYFNKKFKTGVTDVPQVVHLLAEYDAWHDSDKNQWENTILPFQYGMRLNQTTPVKSMTDAIWVYCFENRFSVSDCIKAGTAILDYERQRLSKLAKSCSFEATIAGKKALCLNSCSKSSMSLESQFDPTKHDLMLVYNQVPTDDNKLAILVSFYSTKKDVDCSAIAKQYKGGGHFSAAGCKVKSLEWKNGEILLSV